MNFFKQPLRPAQVILAVCFLIFAWQMSQLAAMRRDLAMALAELQPGQPGLTMERFIGDYLADPFGKAAGMSRRQLQLAQQISARVPGYESAITWRNNAAGIGFAALLYLLFVRYRSRLPIDRWRGAVRAWLQRQAIKMAPLVAEARRRAEEKRRGTGPARSAGGSSATGTVYDVVSCPSCGQKLRLPSGKGTIRVKCAGCGTQFETRT